MNASQNTIIHFRMAHLLEKATPNQIGGKKILHDPPSPVKPFLRGCFSGGWQKPRMKSQATLGPFFPYGLRDLAASSLTNPCTSLMAKELPYGPFTFTRGRTPSSSPFMTGCWFAPSARDFWVTCCSTYS